MNANMSSFLVPWFLSKSLISRRRKKKRMKKADITDCNTSSTNHSFFPQFMSFSEDMQLYIISFISDTPFATADAALNTNNVKETQLIDLCKSPLTHTLPCVSKHFYSLLRSKQADYLWKESLRQRIQNDSYSHVWKNGIISLINKWDNNNNNNTSTATTAMTLEDANDAELILNAACKYYQRYHGIVSVNINQSLFRSLVSGYIRVTGPVFIMPGYAEMNRLIGLRLFEPRYRLLIREVMADSPTEHRMGEEIPGPNYPNFIYANNTPIGVSTPAVIVQVKQCFMHLNGVADIVIMPAAHVWLERIWIRPNTERLHMACAIRMPVRES